MIFFNNSTLDAFVYGNIIKSGDVFRINNFNLLINIIRGKITTPDIIGQLNKIFTPINPKSEDKEQIECIKFVSIYDNIMVTKFTTTDKLMIYNNSILSSADFENVVLSNKISAQELLIMESTVQYTQGTLENETLS